MVVGGYQKACRACGGVVDCLAHLGVDQFDDGADDMARGAELAQLARLFDLAQHMNAHKNKGVCPSS